MPSADLSAEASAKTGRPLSPKDRFREVAALLAQGLLRLRTYPANTPEKPPEFSKLRLDVRRDISPYVADG